MNFLKNNKNYGDVLIHGQIIFVMAAMIIQSFHCVHDSIQVFLKAIFQKLLNGFRVSKIQNFKNLKLVFAMDLSLAP